ncbi:hypothetical protein [Nocardiopsis rhodophaea]|uniref:hypothetical protein n=1 Tax=Nocardiopsis rhodophaea TaxID=280238 RepID=UPI0031D83789
MELWIRRLFPRSPGPRLAAIAAALTSLVALFYTRRVANAAKAQTEIQRELRKDAAQPYVWVDVRPDEAQGTLLNLVLGNSGPTFAPNVRATIEPELPYEESSCGADGLRRLGDSIATLGPGHKLIWSIGRGFELLKSEGPQIHTVTIDAEGPFGSLPQMVYEINLDDVRGTRDAPEGNLYYVRKAVLEVANAIDPSKKRTC